MGVFKKYYNFKVFDAQWANSQRYTVKDINGASKTIYGNYSTSYIPFNSNLSFYASSNAEANHNYDDYALSGTIGTTTFSRSYVPSASVSSYDIRNNNPSSSYTISITNNETSDIVVNSIQFVNNTTTGTSTYNNLLIGAYYFDNSIPIPAGSTITLVINIVTNDEVTL